MNIKKIDEVDIRQFDKRATSPTDFIKAAEEAALLFHNSSKYTWTGKHFIPPHGVPTFTPVDYRQYFAQRNTLFVGDSTGRRAYATLYAIMMSCDEDDDNIKFKEVDGYYVLNFNIEDKPRRNSRKEVCNIQSRNFSSLHDFVCRDLLDPSSRPLCPTNQSQKKNVIKKEKLGRFDFIRRNCLVHVHDFFAENGAFMQDYDLVVLSSGIWESVRKEDCNMYIKVNQTSTVKATLDMKVDALLNKLSETSSSKLQAVFRIPGFDARFPNDTVMLTIGDKMRIFNEAGTNLTFVDWQNVIAKKSFGDERIEGDIPPHYGLEARLLFLQQLFHHLRRLELEHEILS